MAETRICECGEETDTHCHDCDGCEFCCVCYDLDYGYEKEED